MPMRHTRLISTAIGTITGAGDLIVVHPCLSVGGVRVAPDRVDLEWTTSQEAGGAGAAPAQTNLDLNGVPPAADTITFGPETYTWVALATRVLPFTIARGTVAAPFTEAQCCAAAAAAMNADTSLNVRLDAVAGPLVQVTGAMYPGAPTNDNGERSGALNASAPAAWAVADLNLAGGAGNVAGAPDWSVLARTADMVKIRVRGLRATDSLGYSVRCERVHSIERQVVPSVVTGADGTTVLGARTFSALTGNFIASGVTAGDFLVIQDPARPFCNGVYQIATVDSATQLTVEAADAPLGWKATYNVGTPVNYTVGPGSYVTDQETGGQQVVFSEPGTTAHTVATPAPAPYLTGSTPIAQDVGHLPSTVLYFKVAVLAGDTFDVTATETWTAVAGAPGPNEYTLSGVPANDALAVHNAINGDATSAVRSIYSGTGQVILVAKATATVLVGTESTGGLRTEFGTVNPGIAAAVLNVAHGSHLIGAVDLARLAAGDSVCLGAWQGTAVAAIAHAIIIRTSGSVQKSPATLVLTIAQTPTGSTYILNMTDPGGVLGAWDSVRWMVTW